MDITEIRQRVEKTTPGPWSLQPAEWECDCGGDEDGRSHKGPAECRDGWWRDAAWVAGPILIEHGDGWTGYNDADADFMAHAREDVPALCDALETAEAALAEMQTPCVWRVKAPAHFVGHMGDKPLEMILIATSCGKELGVQLPPPYCAYCGHPAEVQP